MIIIFYNETLDYIAEQEKLGEVFVIQPSKPLSVGRVERDKQKLGALYNQGYEEAIQIYEKLLNWINE